MQHDTAMLRFSLICLIVFYLPICLLADDEASEDEDFSFTLGEIIVQGNLSPAEKTASIQEIDEEDIRALGAKNVAEALVAVTGLQIGTTPTSVSANGKGEQLAGLRGFDPRNVIVLIDGVPLYEPYFHVLDLRQIPVGAIAKIKIIKGPASVLYGPNGMGGVINIITKKGAGEPQGHLEGGYGDGDSISGRGSVLGSYKGFDYFFAPGFAKSDGFRVSDDFTRTRNEDGGLRENSDYADFFLAGRTGYEFTMGGLWLAADHSESESGVSFSMEDPQPATLWRKLWTKSSVALHGEVAPVDFFYLRGNTFYTRFYNTITTYEDTKLASVAANGQAVSTYDNDVFGGSLMPSFILGRAGVLTLSTLLKFDQVAIQEEKGSKWNEYGAETYSGALQYELSVYSFDFTTGIAYHFLRRTKTPGDRLGSDDGVFDLSAGVSYDPIRMLNLRVMVARKSAFPDLKTLYGSNGNPDLETEFSTNVEAGFGLTPIKELSIEATWFYSDVTDLIGKQDTGNEFIYKNIDSALITGAEGLVELRLFQEIFTTQVGYTYLFTCNRSDDRKLKRLDFRPEHTLFIDGRLALPFGTSLSVQYRFISKREYEQPGVKRRIANLPEYGLLSARAGHTIGLGNRVELEIYLQGKNILDVYYEDSVEKASPGRMLEGGLAIDF